MARKSKTVRLKSQSASSNSQKRSAKSTTPQKPKSTRGGKKPSLEEVPISPRILDLSKNFKESNFTTYQTEVTPAQWAYHEQIRYLLSLRSDDVEWARLGWKYRHDSDHPDPELDQNYHDQITQALKDLLETHAERLLPHHRMTWEVKKKPGRPAKVWANPYPSYKEYLTVDSRMLYEDIKSFIDVIKKKLGVTLRTWPRTPSDKAVEKLEQKINEVLEYNGPVWSSRLKFIPNPLNLLRSDEQKSSGYRYGEYSYWDLDFDALLKDFIKESQGKLGRDGKPACLVHKFFGQLLDQPSSKIRNFINDHEPSNDPFQRSIVTKCQRKSSS